MNNVIYQYFSTFLLVEAHFCCCVYYSVINPLVGVNIYYYYYYYRIQINYSPYRILVWQITIRMPARCDVICIRVIITQVHLPLFSRLHCCCCIYYSIVIPFVSSSTPCPSSTRIPEVAAARRWRWWRISLIPLVRIIFIIIIIIAFRLLLLYLLFYYYSTYFFLFFSLSF